MATTIRPSRSRLPNPLRPTRRRPQHRTLLRPPKEKTNPATTPNHHPTKHTELAALRQTRTAKLTELHTLRYETAFTLRQQKAAALTTALNHTVRIQLTPAGNRPRYADYLKTLFTGRSISKKVIDLLAESDLTPAQLAAAIRTEQTAAPDDITPLHQLGITPAYRRKLQALPEKQLYKLETHRIPDLPDIALKVGDDYRSLTPPPGVPGLSMGQKCTAVLSIILVERNTPLIIDQPEDDLDNAFIFREIVQTLRREKERRQFIIATHNANIPVSGDAELILLMQANEQHGWIAHRGSIDDPQIREPVENILEGGREAFQLRQSKYAIS